MSRCISYCKEFHLFERRIDELESRKHMVEDSLFNHHREYEMITNELCELKKMYQKMICETDCYLGDDCKDCKNKKEAEPIKELAGRSYQPIRTE